MIDEDLVEIETIVAAKLHDGKLDIVRNENPPPPYDEIIPVMQDHGVKPMGSNLEGRPVQLRVAQQNAAKTWFDWYEGA